MIDASVLSMPPWHRFMHPLLETLADGNVWSKKPMEQTILDRAGIPEAQRSVQTMLAQRPV